MTGEEMARSEICKNCCPQGGALFTEGYGCWPHHVTKEEMSECDWVKVCNNCGHYKPKRKRAPRLSFDQILAQPDDSALRNKHQRAIFHAFSDNGAWKEYSNICEAYKAECKKRGITKYPLLMHKWVNDYHYKKLSDAKKLSAWEVNRNISSLKDQVQGAKEMLERDFLKVRLRNGCRL